MTAINPSETFALPTASNSPEAGLPRQALAGETQKAMAKALALQGMSLADVNQGNADLLRSLTRGDRSVRLSIANSLWVTKKYPVRPDFLQRTVGPYEASVQNVLFTDPGTLRRINTWVSTNTAHRVTNILKPKDLDALTVMVLANAVYFKGSWHQAFDARRTRSLPFHLLSGKAKQVPMMSQTGTFRYQENPAFRAVALPYAGTRLSMYLFLPAAKDSLSGAWRWDEWMDHFRLRKGTVILPRFRMEYETELKPALTALGMGVAFDPVKANFSAMAAAKGPIFIDKVRHKTFVDVSEQGTEAAGATAVVMALKLAQPPAEKPFELRLDRPFTCAIRDDRTGTLLFLGYVADPQGSR